MTDTRQKCWVCNGSGIDYGTCLSCGGQGKTPFREWGKEDDEDHSACPHTGTKYCEECGTRLSP